MVNAMRCTPYLALNFSTTTRKHFLSSGKKFLVAPITLIVPGVLAGSKGALYYPQEEVEKSVPAWDGKPITVNHPVSENGKPLSAKDRSVFARQGIGHLRNARFERGRLIADGWFLPEKTKRVEPRIYQALVTGTKPVEVSTGLFVDEVPVEHSEYRGKSYCLKAVNYRPDHLAILPDERGACSVEDGCGLGIAQNHLFHKGVSEMDKKKTIDHLIANVCCWDEEDRPLLEGLSDNKLQALADQAEKDRRAAAVANAAQKGFEGTRFVYNAETEEVEVEVEAKEKKPPVEEEEEEEENEEATENKWLERAPASIREDLAFARREKAARKKTLIERLTVNVHDPKKRKQVVNRLSEYSLDTLQDLAVLAPEEDEAPAANSDLSINFSGAASPMRGKPIADVDKEDFLPLPKMTYSGTGFTF